MQRADDLQIRIMRELASPASFRWDIRESYASIGKKLGVDAETVRKRVKRAQELGFLQRWTIIPNPDVLGRESAGIHLDVDDEARKPSIIQQVRLVDGVVFIVDFHGRPLRVVFYFESEPDLARRIQLVSSICGAKNLVRWTGGISPCDLKLRRTDWQLVKALRKDPRRSLGDVAREVKVSTRTVKRRLALMAEAKAFYMLAATRGGGYAGVVTNFLVFCPDERKKSTVDKQIPSRLTRTFFSFTTAKGFSIFTGIYDNMAEAEAVYGWIRGLEGVMDARMDIQKENILIDDWLDGEIERQLAQSN